MDKYFNLQQTKNMLTNKQQNTNATNKKRRSHTSASKTNVENASVHNLKSTRNEVKTANLTHVEDLESSKNNQACLKMEARLKPIEDLLESLPPPLNKETKTF